MGREHRSERKKRDYEKDQSPAADETPSGSKKRPKKEKKRTVSPARSRSHTYSPSPRREISPKRRGRSRSRSRDPPASSRYGGSGGGGGGNYGSRRFYNGRGDSPTPNSCLGVFGMSLHTSDRDLKRLFGRYGEVESVQIVYDRYSGRSRGFGFVYFTHTKDATRAKEKLVDAVIDGMKVRVDYSVTRSDGPSRRHVRKSFSRSPVRNRSRSRSRSESR